MAVIGAVAAVAVGGTVAYFSSTAISTGNTMSAGTLNLQVGEDGVVSWSNTPNGLLTLSNMQPGVPMSPIVIRVRNTGTIAGDLSFPAGFLTFAPSDIADAPAPDMSADQFARLVYISTLGFRDGNSGIFTDWLNNGYITNVDKNGDGKVSLYEISQFNFANTGNVLTPGQEVDFQIAFTLGDKFDECVDSYGWYQMATNPGGHGDSCVNDYDITVGEWNVPQGDGINISMTGKLEQSH